MGVYMCGVFFWGGGVLAGVHTYNPVEICEHKKGAVFV